MTHRIRKIHAAAVVFGLLNYESVLYAQDYSGLMTETQQRYDRLLSQGQYMHGKCKETTLADWGSIPLLRCSYSELGASANVTLALPDAAKLAKWTLTACSDAKAKDMPACARHIATRIWSASNAQFPVSGFVIEPKSVLDGNSEEPYCFLFRDGVTVRTASTTSGAPMGGRCQPESAESAPITKAFKYARIASTSREEFALAPGAPAAAQLAGTAFPGAVRKEFTEAWTSGRNRLISGAAIADKSAGKFK